jgi:hypothetical protein
MQEPLVDAGSMLIGTQLPLSRAFDPLPSYSLQEPNAQHRTSQQHEYPTHCRCARYDIPIEHAQRTCSVKSVWPCKSTSALTSVFQFQDAHDAVLHICRVSRTRHNLGHTKAFVPCVPALTSHEGSPRGQPQGANQALGHAHAWPGPTIDPSQTRREILRQLG